MSRLVNTQDALDPGDDLVAGRVAWLVKVDDAVADVIFEWAAQRRVAGWDWCIVPSADVELVVVFEQDWPLGGVKGWSDLCMPVPWMLPSC